MIPENLNPDMQILLLENNPIYEVPIDAFEIVGLQNLKKIVFKNCKLMSIHKDSFRSLKILIELDLSNNKINRLHKDTFVHTERLRWISLNNNLLEELDDGLFRNLGFLQTVILTNNHIHKIGLKTFQNLPFIKVLQLAGNNLTHMSVETISSLKNLTGLDLHRNPWKCDCNLQEFRDLVIKRNLYNSPTDCREPIRNRGRLWKDMDSSEFACKPSIIYPSQTISVEYGVGENITLTCKVAGNPKPEVNWKQGTRIIDGDNKRHGDHRFSIKESDSDVPRWVNLSIINLKYHDRSEYSCIAKNPGGEDEKTISLTVSKMGSGSSGSGNTDAKGLYIGLAVGIIILMIVVALLCYCFCRKRNSKRHTKSDMHSSNGEALIEGSVIPEMEKSLITTVNPVTKPPRRYDAPLSITSGATEMSELNKTLLDNDSIFGKLHIDLYYCFKICKLVHKV